MSFVTADGGAPIEEDAVIHINCLIQGDFELPEPLGARSTNYRPEDLDRVAAGSPGEICPRCQEEMMLARHTSLPDVDRASPRKTIAPLAINPNIEVL